MKFTTRRFIGDVVRLVGRTAADYDQELQEWIEKITRQVEGGIPGGFNEVDPTVVDGTAVGSPGTEATGWAAADHQHALDASGTPGIAGAATSAQGAGPGVSLSGHTHALELTDAVVVGLETFLPHPPRIPKVQAGANVTVTENALGPVIASTGGSGSPDDASTVDAHRAYLSHPPRDRGVRAGANVTVTEDALGYIVASTGGGTAVDDASNIIANQVFGG